MKVRRVSMVALLCMAVMTGHGQAGAPGYAAKWKVVDSLINEKGLTQTAFADVNRIYELAQQEKNEPQQIKALLYRLSLEETTSENGIVAAIGELQKQLAVSRQPAKSILQNILAHLYLDYLQRNRSKLYDRTDTEPTSDKDIDTWSIETLHRKIGALFLSSLEEEALLAKIRVTDYEPVVVTGNVPNLRPTLFDLLAHNAIDYFQTADAWSGRYTSGFEMEDHAIFADVASFVTHHFHADTLSSQYEAILLEQRLLRRHLSDAIPDALKDADIERLVYAHAVFSGDDRDTLYTDAMRRLAEGGEGSPVSDRAWYLLANQYADGASAGADSAGYIRAVAICTAVLSKKDSTEGWKNCRNLLNNIRQRELRMQMENVNIPHRPMRALVSWRNFTRLYWRIIRLDHPARWVEFGLHDNTSLKRLLQQPVYREGDQLLPDTRDYLEHRVEIPLPSLPPGNYLLAVSTDSNWKGDNGIISAGQFAVSHIAYMSRGNDWFVLNRETGRPLAGAVVQLWDRPDNARQPSDLIKSESYTTDDHGHFLLKGKKGMGYRTRLPEISIPGDRLFPPQGGFYTEDEDETLAAAPDKETYEIDHRECFLFTDRSIYRPGQTVFFKGILTTTDFDTHRTRLLHGDSSKVVLFNSNNERIDSVEVVSDDYGSFHGRFKLPEGQLNGRFSIGSEPGEGMQYLSVEEYKRPKYFVGFDRQKDGYRLGDSIRVSGWARAYAGNGIDGGKVSWRVVRRSLFPHPRMRRWIPGPSVSQTAIAHGESTTDAAGRFSVVFPALPDRRFPRSIAPLFEYEVSADITDITGETRSGSTTVVAGYATTKISIEVAGGDRLASDSLRTLVVSTANLSGAPIAAEVHLSMYPLKAPQRLIRQRLWEAPDRFVLTEKQWLDSFPNDEYREETQKENWDRGGRIWETTVSCGKDGRVNAAIAVGKITPGWYLVEARTTDRFGQEAKDEKYVECFEGKTGKPGRLEYDWELPDIIRAEPGAAVSIASGSSADVYVIRTVQHADEDDPVKRFAYFRLNAEKKDTTWNIKESDRGGFGIADAWIINNRLYTHFSHVEVPWTNKELDIHYSSYRDKTRPGSPEKWELRISGNKGERLAAEVLTAMYDASLDQFDTHSWSVPDIYPSFESQDDWDTRDNFSACDAQSLSLDVYRPLNVLKIYDRLLQVGDVGSVVIRGQRMLREGARKNLGFYAEPGPAPSPAAPIVHARKDFRETAFFFPDLRTDSAGNVSFSFTMPEAMTSWKWMTLAHTRDLAFGYGEKTVITQKELMVQPNAPRFLREGDRMELPVKVVNLTDSELTGQVSLELTDPTTGETADGWFTNRQANQYFTVAAKQSAVIGFPIDIPYQYNRPVTYKVVAQAGGYSDGEEATLPVVSNRLLVTESLPLNMPGDGTRHFSFGKLSKSGGSESLNHHALTVEFTANPAWYALQSLPYLMEYPHECSEQVFDRFYANALATRIANSSPRLLQVFDRWRTADTAQLLSKLQKDQQLKNILLEETPWVMEGKSESQQKKNLALLFDMSRMSRESGAAMDRLRNMQSQEGGFPWWSGGPDNRYITQYILTGIGHLKRLNAVPPELAGRMDTIVSMALSWLDLQIKKDYERERAADAGAGKATDASAGKAAVARAEKARPADRVIGAMQVHYLYLRSLFPNQGLPGNAFAAVNYFRKKTQRDWVKCSPYLQGMIALALYRTGDIQTAKDIIASLQQNAIRDPGQGMYWKGMEGGYYWWQAPVETESLLIEAFHEISGDARIDRELKTWLLKQKQTHNWATTTATADACYALLMGGQNWLNAERSVQVRLGDKTIDWPAGTGDAEAGYHKKVFDGPFVNPSMGNITVSMGTKGDGGSPAWGAVYWQYFDILDRITSPGSSKPALSVSKKLFIRRDTDRGPVLEPLADNGELKPGDRVVARIEVRADRDMEYVHLKDMRAACLEPVNVISQYKWQGGLGYYESTKDASTDFFFDVVPRGTYVLEYDLLAGQSGNFSNGITTIECLYAPEFAYHTEGIRVSVEAGN